MRMRKSFLLVCCFLAIATYGWTQPKEVTGRVIDTKANLPLAGVTVNIKGTTNSTQTNTEGFFRLNAPADATLVFSFVGYRPKEVKIGASGVVSVSLEEDERVLNEVVVTAQSVKREARSLGYSTTTIKSEELTRGKDRSVLNDL